METHLSSENLTEAGMGHMGFEQEGGAFFWTSCVVFVFCFFFGLKTISNCLQNMGFEAHISRSPEAVVKWEP